MDSPKFNIEFDIYAFLDLIMDYVPKEWVPYICAIGTYITDLEHENDKCHLTGGSPHLLKTLDNVTKLAEGRWQQVEEKNKVIEKLQADNSSMAQRLSNMIMERDEYKTEVVIVRKQLTDAREEVGLRCIHEEELEAQVEYHLRKAGDSADQVQALMERIDGLKKELNTVKLENSILRGEHEETASGKTPIFITLVPSKKRIHLVKLLREDHPGLGLRDYKEEMEKHCGLDGAHRAEVQIGLSLPLDLQAWDGMTFREYLQHHDIKWELQDNKF